MLIQKGWIFSKDPDTKKNVPFFIHVRDTDIVSNSTVPSSVLLKTNSNFNIILLSDTQDCTTYIVSSTLSTYDYMKVKLYKNGLYEIDALITDKPSTSTGIFSISLPYGLNEKSTCDIIDAQVVYKNNKKVINLSSVFPLNVATTEYSKITDNLSESYDQLSMYKINLLTDYFGSSAERYVDIERCKENCYKLYLIGLLTKDNITNLDSATKTTLLPLLQNVFTSANVFINVKINGKWEK